MFRFHKEFHFISFKEQNQEYDERREENRQTMNELLRYKNTTSIIKVLEKSFAFKFIYIETEVNSMIMLIMLSRHAQLEIDARVLAKMKFFVCCLIV